ncbi:MAG: hypothetical protein BVN35_17790 [Proteobacteria bacterium ST_bin11]|nr:MAG: hypothetical protein BVN35_17790 [Proteobacteria bacterium ST_bin11]
MPVGQETESIVDSENSVATSMKVMFLHLQDNIVNFSAQSFIKTHETSLLYCIVGLCVLLFLGVLYTTWKIVKYRRQQQILARAAF